MSDWFTKQGGVYVIAEIGVNHDGNVEDAHDLIDVARECGADAVKFQTFDPEAIVSATAVAAPYQREQAGVSTQHELLAQYVLPDSAWAELSSHAREVGIDFMSMIVDRRSLDLVLDADPVAIKLGSGDLTNKPLMEMVAAGGKPVLFSTGMSNFEEVDRAVEWLAPAPWLGVLHCVSSYPAPLDQCNLSAIPLMAERYGIPVGWSDHTVGNVSAIASVALGAHALEKHITLDRGRVGPDHSASADPDGFRQYIQQVRITESCLGDGQKECMPAERVTRDLVRRSWHLVRDVSAGETVTGDMVRLLRPTGGLPPWESPLGRTLVTDGAEGSLLLADHVR